MPVAYKPKAQVDAQARQRQGFERQLIWQAVVYCGEYIAVKCHDRDRLAITLHCNSWGCGECQPKRRNRLISDLMRGHPNTMITLTMRPRLDLSQAEAAQLLADKFKALRKLLPREARRDVRKDPLPFGAAPEDGWQINERGFVPRQVNLINGKFEYGAVFELTKIGTPHLHVAARIQWIDQAWLSLQWQHYLNSPIVDVRRIDQKRRAAGYVSKYIGKEPTRIGQCKRYWFSRNYFIEPKREKRAHVDFPGRWSREELSLHKWIAFRTWEGCAIERPCARTAIARAPP